MILTSLVVATIFFSVGLLYPYLIYPAILKVLPKAKDNPSDIVAIDGSQFSLLFCAYNESASMPDKLRNVNALLDRYPGLEVLAYDDGSSDGTADIITRDAPRIRLFRGPGRTGKAHGMKLLASEAKHEILVFTDANVSLDEKSLPNLSACYGDSRIGGVCGKLSYSGAEESATASVGGIYWRLEERIKDLESASGSVMGADGSIFSIRREIYPEFPDTVLDDFTVSMEAVFRGLRLTKCNDVVAYEKLVSGRSDEFARKVRIAARAFHTHLVLTEKRRGLSGLNKFKYFSHKTLRWFGGAFFVLALVSAALLAFVVSVPIGIAFVGFAAIVAILGLKMSSGPLASIAEVVLAMFATLLGIMRAMQGKTFSTWNPAKSR